MWVLPIFLISSPVRLILECFSVQGKLRLSVTFVCRSHRSVVTVSCSDDGEKVMCPRSKHRHRHLSSIIMVQMMSLSTHAFGRGKNFEVSIRMHKDKGM